MGMDGDGNICARVGVAEISLVSVIATEVILTSIIH